MAYPPRSQTTGPYAERLKERFQEGCRNAAPLYLEIKAQGYRGGGAPARRPLRSWKDQLPVRYRRLEALPYFDVSAPGRPYGGCWRLKSWNRIRRSLCANFRD